MIKASWRPGCSGFFKGASADLCAQEIMSIGPTEGVTPSQVLEKARDEGTELHKIFDWDNDVAAEKWRLNQAKKILNHIVIEVETPEKKKETVRYFLKTEPMGAYKQTTVIFESKSETEKLLQMARRELESFKMKYQTLCDMKNIVREVFDL